MSAPITEIERFGLTEVYTCDNPRADVIFVHGLNGHPQRTWTSQKTDIYWPRDLLPGDFDPDFKARVLVYGYDADITASAHEGGTSKDKIHNHAELLVAYLIANRRRQHAEDRPIVFVAHSLGGLVVKRALSYSSSVETGTRTERLRSVFLSTCGIIFMGTPHHGSDLAVWGSYLERLAGAIIPRRILDTSNQLVEALKSDSETLVNIDRNFAQIQDRFNIYYFHEAKKTDLKGTLKFVVDEESAAPTMPNVQRAGIQSDHSHMCKFDGENSPGYVLVSGAIVDDIRDEAERHAVANAWILERQTRRFLHGGAAAVLSGHMVPEISEPSSRQSSPGHKEIESNRVGQRLLEHHPSESFFFVPPGFRENAFFVGMQRQLELIDTFLFNSQRRQNGTASVLLHGAPGSGKTHLARQYVYQNRSKFPGGVFWINARHTDEIEQDLWQIAQKFVASDAPDIRVEPSGKGRNFVAAVTEWFKRRDKWLIVLDGVVIDSKEDAEKLQQVIPDRSDASLIYTSRSSQFHVSHRLMHPHPVRVPPLMGKEGSDLLFRETSIGWTEAREKAALSIVKNVGGLPLAIHAISVRLVQTHERLETYKLRSYADDPKLGGPYHEIMNALFENHRPAYNLMNILAFFAPHIPVELIRLGMKNLRSYGLVVKSATGYSAAPEINNSLIILMRNALMERNEPEEVDSAVSSKSSFADSDILSEPMDVLRFHSVVQRFCRDRLERGDDQQASLSDWIEVASRVLERSYKAAKARMSERSHEYPPRVSDFLQYRVHAQRMREYSVIYEHKGRPPLDHVRVRLDEILEDVKEAVQTHEPRSSQSSVFMGDNIPSIFDRVSATSSSSQMTDDGSPMTEQDLQWHSPWQTKWGTDLTAPVQTSPTLRREFQHDAELHTGSGYEHRTALEMLRSLSEQTVRQQSPIVNDTIDFDNPGSKPDPQSGFRSPTSLHPSVGLPDRNIVGQGEFIRDLASFSSTPPGASSAIPQLANIYRNSPVSPRPQPFPVPVISSPPLSHASAVASPVSSPYYSLPIQQALSSSPPAPPMLTRNSPNPTAAPFYPSSYNQIGSFTPFLPDERNMIRPTWNLPSTHFQSPYPNQSIYPPLYQHIGMYSPSFNDYSFGRQLHPDSLQQQQVPGSQPDLASLDARLYATPNGPGMVDYTGLDQAWRHERAASVPNIDARRPSSSSLEAMRRASATSSPVGWPAGYYQSAQMARATSLQSSPYRGRSVVGPPASAPIQNSPFPQPGRPASPASIAPFQISPPPTQSTQRTSPLHAVQTADEIPLPRASQNLDAQIATTPQFAAAVPEVLIPSRQEEPFDYGHRPSSSLTAANTPPSEVAYLASDSTPRIPQVSSLNQKSLESQVASSPPRDSFSSGIAINDPGYGLGIAEFGGPQAEILGTGMVTFGEHPPVNVLEARRRSLVHSERLREGETRASGGSQPQTEDKRVIGHQREWSSQSELLPPLQNTWDSPQMRPLDVVPAISGPPPYPDINTMPAETDAEHLRRMVEEEFTNLQSRQQQESLLPQVVPLRRSQRRNRGHSEPQHEGWPIHLETKQD